MRRIRSAVVVGLLCGLVMGGSGRGAVAAGAAPDRPALVDINSASAEELAELPGIGPAKARAIIEYRSEEPFRRTEDLRDVKGIGDRLYDQLRGRITVSPDGASEGRGS